MHTYLYDGTFDGLLTAIFDSFSHKGEIDIQRQSHYQPTLLSQPQCVATDIEKAKRVSTSLQERLSWHTYQNVYYMYLSELPGCDYLIYRYLKHCYHYGVKINLAKYDPIIHEMETMRNKVSLEAHRFKGFVRFTEVAPLTFYSKLEPDHNILPLLQGHFVRRFSDQRFIIHDLKREYAVIYDLKHVYFHLLSQREAEQMLANQPEDPYQQLFSVFFDAVNIPERCNPRLQRFWMPKRYWKHIDEAH